MSFMDLFASKFLFCFLFNLISYFSVNLIILLSSCGGCKLVLFEINLENVDCIIFYTFCVY